MTRRTAGAARPRPVGHRRFAGAVALVAALAVTTLAPSARAASYVVVGCADPGLLGQPGQVVRPTDGWVGDGVAPPGGDTCAQGAAGRGLLVFGSGAFAGFAFTAPPGTTLSEAWAWSAAHLPASAGLALDAHAEAGWRPLLPAFAGPLDLGGRWDHLGLTGFDGLRFGVRCDGGGCDPADVPRVEVHSVGVAVDDPAAPVIAPLVGSLLTAGVQQGVRQLQVAASDLGGGLASLSVSVAGQTVDAWTGCTSLGPLFAALPHYDRRVPCPPGTARTVRVDTTAFPDGPEPVEVRAVDAAGNVRTAAAQVVLDNAPPGPGTVAVTGTVRAGERLQAVVGGFAGQDPAVVLTWQRCGESCRSLAAHGDTYVPGAADVGHALRVRVVASDHGGSTTAYSAPTDPVAPPLATPPPPAAPAPVPNGRHADAHARVSAWFAAAPGRRSTQVTVRPGARVRIRGTVRDHAGHAISGATLDVAGLTVRSHADGGFTALLHATSSRTLRVGYRPFSDSRRPVRSPPLRLTVRR